MRGISFRAQLQTIRSSTSASPIMPDLSPSLTELAAQVSKSAALISDHLKSHGSAAPTFAADGLDHFPMATDPAVAEARMALLEASKTIHDLAIGPQDTINFTVLAVRASASSRATSC